MNTASAVPAAPARAGWYNVRRYIAGLRPTGDPRALRHAAVIVALTPCVQALLLLALDLEPWLLLLPALAELLCLFSARQMTSGLPRFGLVAAVASLALVSAFGLFLGTQLLWIGAMPAALGLPALLSAREGARLWPRTLVLWALPVVVAVASGGVSRLALVQARQAATAAQARPWLEIAWVGFLARGGNGSERALLRLRMAQAAFDEADYERAFQLADDGMYTPAGVQRGIPVSPVSREILDALLGLKAVSFYNHTWGKRDAAGTMRWEPLSDELREHPEVRARWAF